ncbi:hypothetical protein E4U55_003571 [Claviceps digitariae]|nr:hypothetical protein E4U55_003571 [Claviceps digitariae]
MDQKSHQHGDRGTAVAASTERQLWLRIDTSGLARTPYITVDMASSDQDILNGPPGLGVREQSVVSGTAISRIESLFESLIDSISSAERMSIRILSRRRVQSQREQAVPTRICFPGRSVREAQKFGNYWSDGLSIDKLDCNAYSFKARIVLILQLAHDALVSNTVLTKRFVRSAAILKHFPAWLILVSRSIFYQHQDLFETQKVVDQLVDDIAITLDLDRGDLNIGIVIPQAASIAGINIGPVRWVLVIEKDARGYPDMATQSFLYSLSLHRPDIPIFILADFDPDGINIFHCYLYGLGRLVPESKIYNRSVRWLGIKSCHVQSLEPFLHETADPHYSFGGEQSAMLTGLSGSISNLNCRSSSSTLELSFRDRKSIVDTLERYISCGDYSLINLVLRRELQVMQMLGYKAEIQLLDESGNLDAWLDYNLNLELTSL